MIHPSNATPTEMPPLTLTPLSSIPLVRPGDDLAEIILRTCQPANLQLADNDILVITSKVVSKAEGRLVNLTAIIPSKEAIELATRSSKDPRIAELILRESRAVLRVRPGTIIVEHRLGFICANAGIDHSNVNSPPPLGEVPGPALPAPPVPAPQVQAVPPWPGRHLCLRRCRQDRQAQVSEVEGVGPEDWVLLLPENPDRSAAEIRAKLEAASGKRLGVMIVDSHGRAWRLGVVGTCIGLSGLPAIVDKRGDPDLFGYRLRITLIAAADELAAAASLVMGQADEGTPVVHVRGFPYPLREGALSELLRPKEQDMFR